MSILGGTLALLAADLHGVFSTGGRLDDIGVIRGSALLLLVALAVAGTTVVLPVLLTLPGRNPGPLPPRAGGWPSPLLAAAPAVAGGLCVVQEIFSGPWISQQSWMGTARGLAGILVVGASVVIAHLAVSRGRRICGPHASLTANATTLVSAVSIAVTLHITDARFSSAYEETHIAAAIALALLGALAGRTLVGTLPRGTVRIAVALATPMAVIAAGAVGAQLVPGSDAGARDLLLRQATWTGRITRLLPAPASTSQDVSAARIPVATPAPDTAVLNRLFPDRERFDVILVTLDTLRADRLGSMGYSRDLTPALDGLAREGVLFRRAYAQYGTSQLSMASMHLGLYPSSTHVLRQRNQPEQLRAEGDDLPLASRFKRHGYRTSASTSVPAHLLQGAMAYLPVGFETFSNHAEGSRAALDSALRTLDIDDHRPLFVWLHLFAPHAPYDAHPEHSFGETPRDLYDGEIAHTDDLLSRFLSRLRERDRWDRTVVIVHGDHGEGLGDHGDLYHGESLYESQVHVPLVVRIPRGRTDIKEDALVELVDLPATMADLVGLPPAPRRHGHSLLHYLVPDAARSDFPPPEPVVFHEMRDPRGTAVAVRVKDLKLIHDIRNQVFELYDLATDPDERRNLVTRRPEDVRRLSSWLTGFESRTRGTTDQLLHLLEHGSPADRWRLAVELRAAGHAGAVARTLVRIALDTTRPLPERLAATTLVGIGPHEDAIPGLSQLSRTPEPVLREGVARALVTYPRSAASEAVLTELEADANVRVKDATACARAWHGHIPSLERVRKRHGSLHGDLRLISLLTLARAGDETARTTSATFPGCLALRAEFDAWTTPCSLATGVGDALVHAYSRLAAHPGTVHVNPTTMTAMGRLETKITAPLLRRLLNEPSAGLVEKHLERSGGKNWLESLREVDAVVRSAWTMARNQRPPRLVMARLARSISKARERGFEDWGILLDLWHTCRSGQSPGSLAIALKRTPANATGLARRMHDRILELSRTSDRAPTGHIEVTHADPALVAHPSRPDSWMLEVEITLDSRGGPLIGGWVDTDHAVRIRILEPVTSTPEATVIHRLPVTGVLPGETVPLVLPCNLSSPRKNWRVVVEIVRAGKPVTGIPSVTLDR